MRQTRTNAKPRRRQCLRRFNWRGVVVSVVALAVVAIHLEVTLDDRSGDLIEDKRVHIRLALEVEHVIERICRRSTDPVPAGGATGPSMKPSFQLSLMKRSTEAW